MTDYDSPLSRSSLDSHSAHGERYHHNKQVEQHRMAQSVQNRPGSTNRGNSSYFDLRRDAMVKSPTATLVADLSQNFHLGASPAVPTPRRSLMAQFSLGDDSFSFFNLPAPVTPYDDELQSSPGEIMDTSPLPQIARRSMVRSVSMFEQESMNTATVPLALQRPKLQSRQPFASFSMPKVPEKSNARRPFHRGKENDDLADQFEASPKKESFRHVDSTYGKNSRPALLPVPANAVPRRLPQFRRTQSMVTKHDDFLEPELSLQQTPRNVPTKRLDITSPITPEQLSRECQILPSFDSKADQMRRINGLTLARVLEGGFRHLYDHLVIIDCRFPHEYSGGHIPDAINISSLEAMDNHALLMQPASSRTLIILHCEYSAHRAPRIALHLRNRDRMMNAHRYPALFYPEMYILDGGYSMFFREHRHLVGSMGYVEMNDPSHKPCASKQMHDFRKHTKFARTQSYTFGQSQASLGGTSMQREDNFKLQRSSSDLHAPQFLAELARPKSAMALESRSENDLDDGKGASGDDSFGDSSMMDIDDPCMTSPLPNFTNTTNMNSHNLGRPSLHHLERRLPFF